MPVCKGRDDGIVTIRAVQPTSAASNANARIIITTVFLIETAMKYSFSSLALLALCALTWRDTSCLSIYQV
jgi:hypothetical protein